MFGISGLFYVLAVQNFHSLAVDVYFQQLLSWLNQRSPIHFETIQVLDKTTYGWFAYVHQKDCSSKEEVQRFYQRLGGLLALLYALEATDMHSENLIASGEQPIIIDLESLFQPRTHRENHPLEYSVIRTHLLPYRVLGKKTGEGIDLSGLNGEGGQKIPDQIPIWMDEGKDTMHLVYKQAFLTSDKNRPILHGNPSSVLDYVDDLISGFNTIYNVLFEHREELLSEYGPLFPFTHVPVRVVFRSTRTYGLLLRERSHPELLQSESNWKQFLEEKLSIAVQHQPWLQRILPFEVDSLQYGDIPYFLRERA